MSKQYVQHISGQGEKWEIKEVADLKDEYSVFTVKPKSEGNWNPRLPKSEYRICEPPERWEDVTETVSVEPSEHFHWRVSDPDNGRIILKGTELWASGYRLRKVQAYQVGERAVVFIVERKISE